MKQHTEIPLLRNGFANFQQRFQLAARVFRWRGKRRFRRGNDRVRHSQQDSIRLATGSTNATEASEGKRSRGVAAAKLVENCRKARRSLPLHAAWKAFFSRQSHESR